jgi:excisionase family DNA binding protein
MAKTVFVPSASFRVSKAQRERFRRALEAGAEVIVEKPDGERLPSEELTRFLAAAMSELASGDEVVLLRGDAEISPAEAGELLGISRQFVDRLMDTGKLPGRRLPGSRHRRLRVADVLKFGEGRNKRLTSISEGVNTLIEGGAEY